MAANLSLTVDGRTAMVAFGRIPVWHGTGQRVDRLMTVEEAAEQSGVFYPVETFPAMYRDQSGAVRIGKGVQIVRTDTGAPLGYASDEYRVVQNEHAFSLLSGHIGSGLSGVMTAGALGKGEKAWMQFVLGEIGVDKVDRGVATLLVTNGFSGAKAVTVGYTTVWVVCANTERAATNQMESSGNFLRTAHTQNANQRLESIKHRLDLANAGFKAHEDVCKALSAVHVESLASSLWRLAIASLAPSDTTIEGWRKEYPNQGVTRFRGALNEIMAEWKSQPGMDLPSRSGTAWGLLNAVTGWVDFQRTGKKRALDQINSIWFGSGADVKDRAHRAAVDRYLGSEPWSDKVEEVATKLVPMS